MKILVGQILLVVLLTSGAVPAQQKSQTIPGTGLLDWQGDLGEKNIEGVHRYLERALARSAAGRAQRWNQDFASAAAYAASVEKNRARLRSIIGVLEERLPASVETFGGLHDGGLAAEAATYTIRQVRWPALEGVWGEGLLLEPRGVPAADVIALPDADQSPEQLAGLAPGIAPESQFARVLAQNRCRVLIPTLIDRAYEFSGNPDLASTRDRITSLPHREWLYRMSYEMGRHVIGYEVQKVLSAVDWFAAQGDRPVGVAGYGEGGLIAFYSAAVDTRIDTVLVSGYFQPREIMWQQPVYRNVWSLLLEFGDAELAGLVFPRSLIVENSGMPAVDYPDTPSLGRARPRIPAPGRIADPAAEEVLAEFNRAKDVWNRLPAAGKGRLDLVPASGRLSAGVFGSKAALQAFLTSLDSKAFRTVQVSGEQLKDRRAKFDARQRQRRQVKQIEAHVQHLLRISDQTRDGFFLDKMPRRSADRFAEAAKPYRKFFYEEVMGKVRDPMLPANARTRLRYEKDKWNGYDVVLDVWPDVFTWGILLIPKDLQPGERRPVVVAQHGGYGVPQDVIEMDVRGYGTYRAFAARLADMGFVVYAPFGLYRGDNFRRLQTKANPLKLNFFSFMIGQHEQILGWLKTLPFVAGDRIAFYGLSWGGKAAMRIPAIVEGYAASVCSGDFNEWIGKNVSVTMPYSYMFTGDYEIFEFNLGMTFNYAEMSYLIFPRPFMVERGHRDGVGADEWVAYEYAKVRRLYDEADIGGRTAIEYFNGGHEINGKGTFEFLRRQLGLRRY